MLLVMLCLQELIAMLLTRMAFLPVDFAGYSGLPYTKLCTSNSHKYIPYTQRIMIQLNL